MLTRPLKVESSAAVEPRAAGGTFFDTDIDLGLASFCRGAGIDPKSVTPEARGAALRFVVLEGPARPVILADPAEDLLERAYAEVTSR